jgi:hypothetical protein
VLQDSQALALRYIKEAVLSSFPGVMRGGGPFHKDWTFEQFIENLREIFVQIRSRQSLLYQKEKQKFLHLEVEIKVTFTAIRGPYVTDKRKLLQCTG